MLEKLNSNLANECCFLICETSKLRRRVLILFTNVSFLVVAECCCLPLLIPYTIYHIRHIRWDILANTRILNNPSAYLPAYLGSASAYMVFGPLESDITIDTAAGSLFQQCNLTIIDVEDMSACLIDSAEEAG